MGECQMSCASLLSCLTSKPEQICNHKAGGAGAGREGGSPGVPVGSITGHLPGGPSALLLLSFLFHALVSLSCSEKPSAPLVYRHSTPCSQHSTMLSCPFATDKPVSALRQMASGLLPVFSVSSPKSDSECPRWGGNWGRVDRGYEPSLEFILIT